RYYDPEIGRFISADTIVPDPNNPQSLNRYSYVNNNPISNIDPSGHSGQGLGIALTFISAFMSGFAGIPLVMAGAWLGAGLSVAGIATRNPYLAAAGAIVLGFVGGFAGGLPFLSGVAGGVLGGTLGYLVSPVSPLSADAQIAIGWALTAYGVLRIAESAARYAAAKLADQTSELASGLDNAPASQSAPYSGDPGADVIGPDFKEGSAIPDAAKQQVLKGAPDLGSALDAARMRHATSAQVAEVSAKYGIKDVGAFARKTDIFVPPGRGVSLGGLAHEVKHVGQFLASPHFAARYEAAFQAGLARGLSPAGAYAANGFELRAFRVQQDVVRANSP
ncbi:MAG: RHS repeat-associated core domain-containing protein, partial [bacterium]